MIRHLGVVRAVASRIATAADGVCEALREERVEQEPAFTDRMLGAIEQIMRDYETKGVRWTAKALTDRGRNAQERSLGADFAGVLSVTLPGFKVIKGFLAQAKLVEPGTRFSTREFARMKEQCERMLSHTPHSFVFLYSRHGVSVVPAVSIASSEPRNPHEFYSRRISRFYEEHLESYIGDRDVNAPTPEMLDRLRAKLETRRILYLEACPA